MEEEFIYDLTVRRLKDGGAELSQNMGCGESATITLHRIHLRYLVEQFGNIKPEAPDALARRFAQEIFDTLNELRECQIDEDKQLHLFMRLRWFVDEFVWPTGLLDDYVDDEEENTAEFCRMNSDAAI